MKAKTNISVRNNLGYRVTSNMIVGEKNTTYSSGDILDANAVQEKIEDVIGLAPEDLDTIAEAAQAILTMKDDIEEIETKINQPINKTWAQLKSLRDSGQLQKGATYRITDYTCTTTQTNTQSAGHVFDIIVRADDVNKLNENAHATLHSGDTYFVNSKLESWELKYCIDNDDTLFNWADTVNGKGVIYYMKDEWNNECPYDFKNIQFKRWKVVSNDNVSAEFNGKYVGNTSADGTVCPQGYTIDNVSDFVWMYTFSGQKTYWDADEESIVIPSDITSSSILYDLSNVNISKYYNEDDGAIGCINNQIKIAFDINDTSVFIQSLNNNVFTGWFVDVNTLPQNYEELYGDTIFEMMGMPYSNIFGAYCVNNTFLTSCNRNTFGNNCWFNTLGDHCSENTFKDDCSGNIVSKFFVANILGSACSYNTFGSECRSNIFGYLCYTNSFGIGCSNNLFGNDCHNNLFGNYCANNVLINSCSNVILGDLCQMNTFGNTCFNITFGIFCMSNTIMSGCHHISFNLGHCANNIIENGNGYITLTSTQTISSANVLQNIKIAQGVNCTTTIKTISHDTVNDTFQTVYQPANSQTISV